MEQRKTVIVTDSSCDLSDEQLAQYGIRMIPLRIITKEREYRDRVDITPEKLYEMMTHELPKTSLPLPGDVHALYDQLISEGVEDVLHISISSGLSGTYNMINLIAKEYEGRLNIKVVDSMTLSTGLGMIVLEAAKAMESGMSREQAVEVVTRVRKNQLGMFVIKTLEFLRKGGRIGLVEGVLGSILQLKPVIFVNDEGVYQTLAKSRGYNSAIDCMVGEVTKRFGQAKIKLSVVNGMARAEAVELLGSLKGKLNIVESFIAPVTPALAIHTGPGLLGIVASLAE